MTIEKPDPETRARRIAAATVVALCELEGIGRLRALEIMLAATHHRLLEIERRLAEIRSEVGVRQ